MTPPTTGIRASDAEREQVAKLLQTAVGEGRLTPEEAGDRLAQASSARFRDELDRLITDLPPAPGEVRARPVPLALWIAGGVVRAAAFMGLIAVFWGFGFWPLWLFGLFGFLAITRAMRFGWYARRRWWMMHRGYPHPWMTVVR